MLIEEIHLQECYRVPSYLASLANLYQREMRAVLRGATVVEMYADQIEMMTTGRHAAAVSVVMEVILEILVIRETWEIAEIVEIKVIRGCAIEVGPGHQGVKRVMMEIRRPFCRWAEETIRQCCILW